MFINKNYVDVRINSQSAKVHNSMSRVKRLEATKSDIDHTHEGLEGPEGPEGVQGVQGEQGLQGVPGDDGAQGIQGIQGDVGLQGDQGEQGIQGVAGDTGSQGGQGEQGTQGVQGDTGNTGSTGSQGIQGVQGDTGGQGIQGVQGEQGEQGVAGESGLGVIIASGVQAIQYQASPTPQPVNIQINAPGGEYKTLTIWKGNNVSFSIPDNGCSVTQENPFVMSGSVSNLNSNLASMTVTAPAATFPMDQACAIQIGVDAETKEIILQPVSKSW